MKILQVIHGYPMRYNAGSEVYTQTLCHALAERHEVQVFTREEDPFAPDYSLRRETSTPTTARALAPRQHAAHPRSVPARRGRRTRFAEVLDGVPARTSSTSVTSITSRRRSSSRRPRGSIPIVYTLHDYWLMCPRGQFMQMDPDEPDDLWAACDGQEDRKCAERCYAGTSRARRTSAHEDVAYWTGWVGRRMRHVREMIEFVDVFVAPARYLHDSVPGSLRRPRAKAHATSTTASTSGGSEDAVARAESRSPSGTSGHTSRPRGSTI